MLCTPSNRPAAIDGTTLSRNVAAYERPAQQYVPDPNDPNDPALVSTPYDIGAIFGRGGGYCGLSSTVKISDSSFTNNQASASGGGIYYSGSELNAAFVPVLHNCLMTGNTAGRDGGGVSSNWHAEPTISNCTITENKVSALSATTPASAAVCTPPMAAT